MRPSASTSSAVTSKGHWPEVVVVTAGVKVGEKCRFGVLHGGRPYVSGQRAKMNAGGAVPVRFAPDARLSPPWVHLRPPCVPLRGPGHRKRGFSGPISLPVKILPSTAAMSIMHRHPYREEVTTCQRCTGSTTRSSASEVPNGSVWSAPRWRPLAHQGQDSLEVLAAGANSSRIGRLQVDGGVAQNDLLMQIRADLADCVLVRPRNVEPTALGSAPERDPDSCLDTSGSPCC